MFETLKINIRRQAKAHYSVGVNIIYIKANQLNELVWKIKVFTTTSKIVIMDDLRDITVTESDLEDQNTVKYLKSINLL